MSNPWDVLVIPSRGRADKVVPFTINAFREAGCTIENVEVWVNETELDAYRATTKGEQGITIRSYLLEDVPGETELNLRVARTLIARAYEPGTRLVCADDDIKRFQRLRSTKELEQADMSKVIPTLRAVAAQYNDTLFGIYPVANGYFMSRRITTDLRLIVGAFYGYTVKGDLEVETPMLDEKEDSERTIRFYMKNGAVVRAEHVCLLTNFYGERGGMQLYRTEESNLLGATALHRMWPFITSEPKLERSGRWEVRLKSPAQGRVFSTSGVLLR